MYIAIGVYGDGRPEARVAFETLEAALRKLQDWVEADEIDDEPMFRRYALELDPPLAPKHGDDEGEADDDDDDDAARGMPPLRLWN